MRPLPSIQGALAFLRIQIVATFAGLVAVNIAAWVCGLVVVFLTAYAIGGRLPGLCVRPSSRRRRGPHRSDR